MITVSRGFKTTSPSAEAFENELNAIMTNLVEMEASNVFLLDSAIAADLAERHVTMTLTIDTDDVIEGEQVADSCITLAVRQAGHQVKAVTQSRSAELVGA